MARYRIDGTIVDTANATESWAIERGIRALAGATATTLAWGEDD